MVKICHLLITMLMKSSSEMPDSTVEDPGSSAVWHEIAGMIHIPCVRVFALSCRRNSAAAQKRTVENPKILL